MIEKKTRNFEQSMKELEDVVKKLESGELSLNDSLTAFEKGMKLAKECESKLSEASGKVEKLIRDSSGGLRTEKFEPTE